MRQAGDAAASVPWGDDLAISRRDSAWLALPILLAAAFGHIDRVIIQTLGQAIKHDLRLGDVQLGMLGGLSFPKSRKAGA